MKYKIKVEKGDGQYIQEELFKLGYKWYGGISLMSFDSDVWFYLKEKQIQWGLLIYNDEKSKEVTLEELKEKFKNKTMDHKEAILSGKVSIKCKQQELAALNTFLNVIGVKTYKELDSSDSSYVALSDIGVYTVQWSTPKPGSQSLTFLEFLSRKEFIFKPTVVEVELNSNYKALVSKECIVVGCQTFDIAVLEKLVAAHKEVSE